MTIGQVDLKIEACFSLPESGAIAPVVAYLAARLREEYGDDDDESSADDLLSASGPPADACTAVLFDDASAEAEWIAKEVKELVDAGTSPRDICILARQKAADYAEPVMSTLGSLGIESRLEEALQDLLTEPVVLLISLALRALVPATPTASWRFFESSWRS